MADFSDHIAQSDHNRLCSLYILERPEYRDWAITTAFYSAVHLVEACFDTRGLHTEVNSRGSGYSKHEYRHNKLIELDPQAAENYAVLKAASNELRYLIKKRGESRQDLFDKRYPPSVAVDLIFNQLPELRAKLEKTFARRLSDSPQEGDVNAADPTAEEKDND